MEQNSLLMKVLVVLLSIIALEGAAMIGMDYFNQDSSTNDIVDDEEEMNDLIEQLNTRGGKIYFNNGNTNTLKPNTNHVSLIGDVIHIAAHDGYKESFTHISNVAEIVLN